MHLGGREGLGIMRTKVDKGGGALLYVDILFNVITEREKRTFKVHFIIIFLCLRRKNKKTNKKLVQYACLL